MTLLELSKAAASLLIIVDRVFISLLSKFTGDRKKDCLPSSNPRCIQQLAGEQGAAGRQQLTVTLPDACLVDREKRHKNSQLP